jgi:hypothetical protein
MTFNLAICCRCHAGRRRAHAWRTGVVPYCVLLPCELLRRHRGHTCAWRHARPLAPALMARNNKVGVEW